MTAQIDVVAAAYAWLTDAGAVALATVIETRHSAPRAVGAAMAIAPDGAVAGSVSGGCVETEVILQARDVLDSGQPRRVAFCTTDQDAAEVGLTCGGEIDVFVERIDARTNEAFGCLARAIGAAEPVAVATVVGADAGLGAKLVATNDAAAGTLGGDGLDAAVATDARAMLAAGETGLRHYDHGGERQKDAVEVFIQSYAAPPRLYILGAVDTAAALSSVGKLLGFHVTVCDARMAFATTDRFPHADQVVVQWPHRLLETAPIDARTVICVLTHDAKFDVPALTTALRSPAGYVGAMGSRRTHDGRMERLRAAGVSESDLDRVRSPVGLDLGGRSPEEMAIAIAAEWIQLRCGGGGRPLCETTGPVHADRSVTGATR